MRIWNKKENRTVNESQWAVMQWLFHLKFILLSCVFCICFNGDKFACIGSLHTWLKKFMNYKEMDKNERSRSEENGRWTSLRSVERESKYYYFMKYLSALCCAMCFILFRIFFFFFSNGVESIRIWLWHLLNVHQCSMMIIISRLVFSLKFSYEFKKCLRVRHLLFSPLFRWYCFSSVFFYITNELIRVLSY